MKQVLTKRIFGAMTLLLFAATSLFADNDLLNRIEEKGNGFKTLKAEFTQVKTIAANGREIVSKGTLYYAPEKFAMHYTPDSKELLIINGKDFQMIRGKKKGIYNTETNKVMCSLRNTLLMCMSGDLTELAKENNAEITAKEKGSFYHVTLTAREKAPKGYATILLSYDRNSGFLMEMTMNEFNGNSTVYTMSDYRKNGKLEEDKFIIRKK